MLLLLSQEEREQILSDAPKVASVTVLSNRGARGVSVPGAADRGALLGIGLDWINLYHAHSEQKKVNQALDEYAKTVPRGEQARVDAWVDENNNFRFLFPADKSLLSSPRWNSIRYIITGTNSQKGVDKKRVERKAQKEFDTVLNEYTTTPQLGPVIPEPSSRGEGQKELDEALNLSLPALQLGPVTPGPSSRGEE